MGNLECTLNNRIGYNEGLFLLGVQKWKPFFLECLIFPNTGNEFPIVYPLFIPYLMDDLLSTVFKIEKKN